MEKNLNELNEKAENLLKANYAFGVIYLSSRDLAHWYDKHFVSIEKRMGGKMASESLNGGFAGMARPKGLLVWVHVASVGEMVAVLPLIHKLLENFPAVQTLLTSGTVTSAKMQMTIPMKELFTNMSQWIIPVCQAICEALASRYWPICRV